MRHPFALALCALLLTLPASAQTWRLDYATQARVERSPTTTGPGGITEEAGTLRVYLSPNRFATFNAEGQGVAYDFDAGTLTFAGTKGIRTVPLIADPAFRVMEMQNVIQIESSLRIAGVTERDEVRDLIDIETRFSMAWPRRVDGLPAGESDVQATDEGRLAWLHNGETEARWQPHLGDPALPDTLGDAARLWLLYTGKLHPDLWASVAAQPQVPDVLTTSWRDGFQRSEVEWRLTALDPDAAWPELDRPEPAAEGDTLGLWLGRLETRTDLPPRTTPAQFEKLIAQAADREPLDALLLVFEQAFQDGQHPGTQVQALSKRFADQPRIIAFREANTASQQDPGPDGLAARMAALDRHGLEHAYILDLFQANGLAESGRPDEALVLLGRVIDRNPHLTGVWNDIGQIYLRRYDTFGAWRCFAVARSIAPEHPMLAGITGFEQRIRNDFPHFFPAPAPVE